MCGLLALHTAEKFGFVNYELSDFKHMLLINSLRGSHSTGLAGVNSRKENEIAIVKSTGSPYSLMSYDNTEKFFTRALTSFDTVIGHGRFATRGAVNAINAHPFEEGHITLAHNGTISNFYDLKDTDKHSEIEVDSHLIAKLIEEEGAENILPKVQGAYVFIWYDSTTQKMNVVRNSERPLWIGTMQNRDTIIMASEAETLQWNAARNHTPLKSLIELPTHQIHSYSAGSNEAEIVEYKPEPKKSIVIPTNVTRMTGGTDHTRGTSKGKGWKNRQTVKSNMVSDLDSDLVNELKESITLEIGCLVRFEINDFDFNKGWVSIVGYSSEAPTVVFRGTISDNLVTEDDLIKCDYLAGTISSIYPMYHRTADNSFTVFVGELTLINASKDKVDGEELLDLYDINGDMVWITRYRLAELAESGCAWCGLDVHDSDLVHAKDLLIHNEENANTGVVCSSCASGWVRMYQKQTKH